MTHKVNVALPTSVICVASTLVVLLIGGLAGFTVYQQGRVEFGFSSSETAGTQVNIKLDASSIQKSQTPLKQATEENHN